MSTAMIHCKDLVHGELMLSFIPPDHSFCSFILKEVVSLLCLACDSSGWGSLALGSFDSCVIGYSVSLSVESYNVMPLRPLLSSLLAIPIII